MKERLYIAYGSNLNLEQMAVRCPTAHIIGTGKLQDWKLKFRGSQTGAYATIEKCNGSVVPVAVWSIGQRDEFSLDIYEGYPNFYYKSIIQVTMDNGKIHKAMVYIMNKKAEPGAPSLRYIRMIEKGYRKNHLDLSYLIDALQDNSQEMSFYL
jgi:hypothetical protein